MPNWLVSAWMRYRYGDHAAAVQAANARALHAEQHVIDERRLASDAYAELLAKCNAAEDRADRLLHDIVETREDLRRSERSRQELEAAQVIHKQQADSMTLLLKELQSGVQANIAANIRRQADSERPAAPRAPAWE